MNVLEAIDEMRARLKALGVRTYLLGEQTEAECVVMTVPELLLETASAYPTDAIFGLAAVVKRDEKMVPNLLRLVRTVIQALDESTYEFAITDRITPAQFPSGANTLPAYLIQVEVALNDG